MWQVWISSAPAGQMDPGVPPELEQASLPPRRQVTVEVQVRPASTLSLPGAMVKSGSFVATASVNHLKPDCFRFGAQKQKVVVARPAAVDRCGAVHMQPQVCRAALKASQQARTLAGCRGGCRPRPIVRRDGLSTQALSVQHESPATSMAYPAPSPSL